MSKAFTRETDGDDEDDGIALPPLPVGGKNYITPAGYARLRAELLGLMDEERPKVVEAVHWAAKNGDRSENGDYLYGKKRLREIDRRIRFLTKRLEIAEVTDPSFEQGANTYIRTDSVNISDEAIAEVRAYAEGQGWKLPDAPRKFKTKAGAPAAHEAIRPAHIDVLEAAADEHQRKLYALIWKRTVASQLDDARYKVNSVTLEATDGAKPL